MYKNQVDDIAIIKTGIIKNHGPLSEKYLRELISEYNQDFAKEYGKINKEEEEIIVKSSVLHTEKEQVSDDLYVELLKDVDSLDRFLHGLDTYGYYIKRSKNALKDLGFKDMKDIFS